MDHSNPFAHVHLRSESQEPPKDESIIDLERLLSMAIRQAKVVALAGLIGLCLGVVYIATTPKSYTASSSVLIDQSRANIIDEASSSKSETIDDETIQSQVEVLKSSDLAVEVVKQLNLTENQSFMNPPTSLLSRVIGSARGLYHSVLDIAVPEPDTAPAADDETTKADRIATTGGTATYSPAMQAAIGAVRSGLIAERVGQSHVIVIGYESHDPEIAAEIANAYAQAYVSDQINSGFDTAEKSATWLQGRLLKLRTRAQDASLAVQQYRSENGLTATRGELIADQQLSDLNTQLSQAKADAAQAYARYQQFQDVAAAGADEAASNAMISSDQAGDTNSIVGKLKARYLDISNRLADVTEKFGSDHPQAVALRQAKKQVGNQLHEQVVQLAARAKSDYQVARSRVNALQKNVDQASGQSSKAKTSEVKLRNLEQKASALQELYQSLLARYEELTQQSTYPVSNIRVLSRASEPSSPSGPNTKVTLGLSLVLGLMLGGGFGAMNEFNERFFRTEEDVTNHLGYKFLGYLPVIPATPPSSRETREGDPKTVSTAPMLRYAADYPASAFAETLRNAKIAGNVVLENMPSQVIGLVSVLPGEGKSTVALNIAHALAASGLKTLLIDGDLRKSGATRMLGVHTEGGILKAVAEIESWRDELYVDAQTGLSVMPGAEAWQFSHTGEFLASEGMRTFISQARQSFDRIVIDLPPLGPVVDAKAFTPLADQFIFIVEWGKTPRHLVRSILEKEQAISEKILGVMLNKVSMKKLKRYGVRGSSERFMEHYARYYGASYPEYAPTPHNRQGRE